MTAPPGIVLVDRVEQIIAEGLRAGLKIIAIRLVAKDLQLWRREVESLVHASTGPGGPTYRGVPVRSAIQGKSAVVAQDSRGRIGVCAIAGDADARRDATGALPVVWRAMGPPTRH